jgi:hypothetical protein
MSITEQLSSQVGDRTEASNKAVAARCLEHRALLGDIHTGLSSKNSDLQGDCAEVLTLVAEKRPELVVPYAEDLLALLAHKKTRVRWEAMHALSIIAEHVPASIESNLPLLSELIQKDASTIVRDHAVDAVAHYARVGPEAAEKADPILRQALSVRDGKHAKQALYGLGNVAQHLPEKRAEIRALAEGFRGHKKGVVRKAAETLLESRGQP